MAKKPTNTNEIKMAFEDVDPSDFRRRLGRLLNKDITDVEMSQLINGLIQVGPVRARIIEKASRGKVGASVLRPDIFRR